MESGVRVGPGESYTIRARARVHDNADVGAMASLGLGSRVGVKARTHGNAGAGVSLGFRDIRRLHEMQRELGPLSQ